MKKNIYLSISLLFLVSCATLQEPGRKVGTEQPAALEIKKFLAYQIEDKAYEVKIVKSDIQLNFVYRVEKGDSLWSISSKVYGNSFLWPALSSWDQLKEPDCLSIGQKIFYANKTTLQESVFIEQAKERKTYTPKLCK